MLVHHPHQHHVIESIVDKVESFGNSLLDRVLREADITRSRACLQRCFDNLLNQMFVAIFSMTSGLHVDHQIAGPDQDDVNSRHLHDVSNIADRFFGLDHDDQHDLVIGMRPISRLRLVEETEANIAGGPPADWWIIGGFYRSPRLLGILDHGYNDAHRPHIEDTIDGAGLIALHANDRSGVYRLEPSEGVV